MPVFPNSFFAKLGSFNNRDNIKLPSTDVPVINSQVTFSPGAGNTTTNPPGYIYHTFTSTGSLTVGSTITNADIFMVGGGGVGGRNTPVVSGGGGSGGGMYATQVNLPAQTYTIIVGAGGTAVNGVNSVIAPSSEIRTGIGSTMFIVVGGGRGGGGDSAPGNNSPAQPGGSGGGASNQDNTPSLFTAPGIGRTYSQPAISSGIITSYGSRGGNFGSGYAGGGGGLNIHPVGAGGSGAASAGAGGIGTNPTPLSGNEFTGNVIGVPSLQPLNGHFGGGGGGGSYEHHYHQDQGWIHFAETSYYHASGGTGGGAPGGFNGTANSGGGGGGGGGPTGSVGGSGGSGIVIVRYAVPA